MAFIWLKNTLSRNNSNIFYSLILLCILYVPFQLYKTAFTFQSIVIINDLISTNKPTSYYHLSTIKKKNSDQISFYYRHATSSRNSSYPYISGDTFRAFSDYIFDETRQDNLNSVKYGDIIFVKADMFSKFFPSAFNSIQKPFVLITHNSDYSAPLTYQTYLSDPKILVWYASNPSLRDHKKLLPIPIGLANRRWPQGDIDKMTHAFRNYSKPWSNRTTLLYVNFAVSTNKMQRENALSQASKFENVQIIKERITFETYLQQIGNAKFVLSPPGNGLDCHRTWESLLMNAVPIVLTSGLDSLFAKTKSIIIDDWSKLTEHFLLSFNFSSDDNRPPDVLNARYWHQTLLKHRNNN